MMPYQPKQGDEHPVFPSAKHGYHSRKSPIWFYYCVADFPSGYSQSWAYADMLEVPRTLLKNGRRIYVAQDVRTVFVAVAPQTPEGRFVYPFTMHLHTN